jgi:hypothetical protein
VCVCVCVCVWENNPEMDLREIGYNNVDWIQMAQDKVQL